MKITITKAKVYNFSNKKQCNVTTSSGRLQCTDESLFEILQASEGKELDLTLDGSAIVGIVMDKKSAPTTPAEKPARKSPSKKEEPKETTPEVVEAPEAIDESVSDSDAQTPNEPFEIEQVTNGLTDKDKLNPEYLFPLMRAQEIELRIGQIFDWGVTLLLYKDARCDQERLDSVFGPFNWQKSYYSIEGRLYCTVSVKDSKTGEWVSKSDVGTESNTEAEKGQASDAFKRACVCWGSGRELYSAPEIVIKAKDTRIEKNAKGKLVCKDEFKVAEIGYDDSRNINQLTIVNGSKNVVFKYNKK